MNGKQRNRQRASAGRRNFLLTFFDEKDGYAEKEVNGFWLVKQWNGDAKDWQVAIFSKESFNNYKGIQKQGPLDYLNTHLNLDD